MGQDAVFSGDGGSADILRGSGWMQTAGMNLREGWLRSGECALCFWTLPCHSDGLLLGELCEIRVVGRSGGRYLQTLEAWRVWIETWIYASFFRHYGRSQGFIFPFSFLFFLFFFLMIRVLEFTLSNMY